MRVVATEKIKEAQQRYPAAHMHLDGWYQIISQSSFGSEQALRATFGDIRGFNFQYKFPIPETTLLVHTLINFESQVAFIETIKPWQPLEDIEMQETLERAVHHWNMVAPVIDTPKSHEDYQQLLGNLKTTMELVENRPNSPLSGLIKAMSRAAEEFERRHIVAEQGNALLALRYLIKLHNVKQADLKEIGSQGVVSEILNGKRSLTIRHVRELAKRFNVSPSTFIDA